MEAAPRTLSDVDYAFLSTAVISKVQRMASCCCAVFNVLHVALWGLSPEETTPMNCIIVLAVVSARCTGKESAAISLF